MQYSFFLKPNFISKWSVIYNKQRGISGKNFSAAVKCCGCCQDHFLLYFSCGTTDLGSWTNLSFVQTQSKMEPKDWNWALHSFKYIHQPSIYFIKQQQCPTLIGWRRPCSESRVRLLPRGEHIVEDCRGEKHILKLFFFWKALFQKFALGNQTISLQLWDSWLWIETDCQVMTALHFSKS